MITRIPNTNNGYVIGENANQDQFKDIVRSYRQVRCIIVHKDTYRRFQTPLFGRNIITINNKVNPGEFYLNSVN